MKEIPRGQNSRANSLAMLATSLESSLPRVVIIEEMDSLSLTRAPLVGVCNVHVESSRMDPIVTFLKQGLLPKSKCEVEKVCRSAPRYWPSKEQKLYKRSYSKPYLLSYIQKWWNPCWKSCMKASMGVIQEEGL